MSRAEPNEKRFLSQKEAAEYLGFHVNTLNKLSKSPAGPPLSRISPRLLRYRRDDLDAWMESRRVQEAA